MYNTEELKSQALELIESRPITLHADIYAMLGISKQTYHNHKLNQDEDIRLGIQKNKAVIRLNLRAKWASDGHPTTEIALYKMNCSEEEFARLTNQTIKVEGRLFSGWSKEQFMGELASDNDKPYTEEAG
jgi:hypothetical protein